MNDRALKHLHDVTVYARAILQRTRGRTADDLRDDDTLRSACLRDFATVGEAINRLRRDAPEVAARLSDPEQIVRFRNRIVHGYDTVSLDRVWEAVAGPLPVLLAEVDALLAEADGGAGG